MMSVTPRRLPHRWVAVLVPTGVVLMFLISGSAARAAQLAGRDLNPQGVAVAQSEDVSIATRHSRVVEDGLAAPTTDFTSVENAVSLTVAFTDASTAVSPATVTDSNGQTSTFTQPAVVAAVHASLTHPTVGQTNVNTANLFTWTDIPAGYGYQLWIGTKPGDGSLLKSGILPATTSFYKVPPLPTGVTLWARLYTEVSGGYGYQDVPFTVTGNWNGFTYPYPTPSPAVFSTLTPFSWSPATGAQGYQLTIGTKPGTADLVNSGILAPDITNYRVPALPTNGTLYAKIVAKIAGSWSTYQAIPFNAGPNPVAFTDPTQGQTGVITPAKFTWSTSPAATGYQMWIGTSHHGSGNLVKSGWLRPGTSSYPVPALPAGQTLYARIYTGVASGWGNYEDVTFTTATADASTGSVSTVSPPALTNQLTAVATQRPTPAWMRRLLALEPDLHRSVRDRHG